jgi:hypothetical protein
MNKRSKAVPFTIAVRTKLVAATCATFVLVALAKYVIVAQLLAIGVSRFPLRVQDAVITGALAATLVFLLLKGSERRRWQVAAQLQAVADLNHNVRNALEVIVGSEYLPQPEKVRVVLESVARIDRTLEGIQLFVEGKKSNV